MTTVVVDFSTTGPDIIGREHELMAIIGDGYPIQSISIETPPTISPAWGVQTTPASHIPVFTMRIQAYKEDTPEIVAEAMIRVDTAIAFMGIRDTARITRIHGTD
jgi:hypothetical protein